MPSLSETSAHATPVKLAITFIRTFGDRALMMVRERAEQASGEPEAAVRWSAVADSVQLLIKVQANLREALSMLEAAGETSAAPHLDLAITQLGFGAPHPTEQNLPQPKSFSKLS